MATSLSHERPSPDSLFINVRHAACLLAVSASLWLPGCAATQRRGQGERSNGAASHLGKQMDITGTLQRNEDIGNAAEAVRQRVEQVDVDLLNETLAEIGVLLREIRVRVIAVPEDVGKQWGDAFDAARVASLSQHLHELTEQADAKLAAIDPTLINGAAAELRDAASRMSAKIETLDVAAANKLIDAAGALAPGLQESIAQTRALVVEIRKTVKALPVTQTENSLAQIEHAGAAVAPTLRRLVTIAWFVLVGLAVALTCLILALRRVSLRPPG